MFESEGGTEVKVRKPDSRSVFCLCSLQGLCADPCEKCQVSDGLLRKSGSMLLGRAGRPEPRFIQLTHGGRQALLLRAGQGKVRVL